MKQGRYRNLDGVHWGEIEGSEVFQLSALMGRRTGQTTPLSDLLLLPPCEPKVVVCVGRNYADHVQEMGGTIDDLPREPGLFLKGPNTIRGSGDPIPYPRWTKNLHYEGELAVVIGRTLRNVEADEALAFVLGYTCACDVTARDKQRNDLQWTRGKAADGFCPIGPWVETDLDPRALSLQTRVNGQLRQDSNTRDLIFPVPDILSYISQFMTLEPGDVVLTGTPEGVGPLEVGDTVQISVEGIGELVTYVADEESLL
jgi:2-keto-4-pentenoate hydratase/2-oxohepta-3-ene-1,7-dioic acid hydratase in catechol pathway